MTQIGKGANTAVSATALRAELGWTAGVGLPYVNGSAAFKVPTMIKVIDSLPKTSIGKVSKDVLRRGQT